MRSAKSQPNYLFGLSIMVALLPLSFVYSGAGVQFLLDTELKYLVWAAQVAVLATILMVNLKMNPDQLLGLSFVFAIVPFTFTFDDSGAYFFILSHSTSAVLSWAIASVLLGKFFMGDRITEKLNH